MKVMSMLAIVLVVLATGCATSSKNEEFKSGSTDCAMMCKENPEVKEYSQSQGGGFMLLFFGREEIKCACGR